MPRNGLTGVPVVKIISIRIIYNFFTYIYIHTQTEERSPHTRILLK